MDDELRKRFPGKFQDQPVFYADYMQLSVADRWFGSARAYMGSSNQLLQDIDNGALTYTICHMLVADFLLQHSVELFLKGAIARADEDPLIYLHHLDELYERFRKLYPGEEYEFKADIKGVVRRNNELPQDQFARYPTNCHGKPWTASNIHYSLPIFHEQTQLFLRDYERIEPLLKQRHQEKS